MFLGAYRFAGDPNALLPAYGRLVEAYPDSTDLHVCVIGDGGIVVLDACPSREVFEGFSRSREFLDAIAAAGLPAPQVELFGEVHRARLRESVGR